MDDIKWMTSFGGLSPPSVEVRNEELVLGRVGDGEVQAASRYHFQFVVPKSTHDRLRHAQGLLSHAIPTGDLARDSPDARRNRVQVRNGAGRDHGMEEEILNCFREER
jgi:hypothetical protein